MIEKRPSLLELNKSDVTGFFLSDKGWLHNYLPSYEKIFTPYRDLDINIFEVGYLNGGSCQLFEKFFSVAKIKAIDITPCIPPPTSNRVKVELMDARDLTQEYFKDFVPTIAIDDGSHLLEDQVSFIITVYPVLAEGGILIVEDIQNIEKQKVVFDCLNIPYEIIDVRHTSGRYDDVFLLYRK